jgi:endonuclease/exonuclease/phosphatase family metal-dependent hydrolase
MPIRIATWNANGFFGQPVSEEARRRLRHRRRILSARAAASDIVCLQEAHGSCEDLAELRSLFPSWLIFGSFCPVRAAGGVVVMIAANFAATFSSIVDVAIADGRVLRVLLDGPLGSLNVVCIHSNPRLSDAQRLAELRLVARNAGESANTVSVIVGDFNVQAPGEERFDLLNKAWSASDQRLAGEVEDCLGSFTEVLQPNFTRVGREGGLPRFCSRIDRLFTDMPTIDLLDAQPFGVTDCNPAAANLPSDHCAVTFVFRRLLSRPPDRVVLPTWLVKSVQFETALTSLIVNFVPDLADIVASHGELKELMHIAAIQARRALKTIEPDSAERKLYIAMKTARAIRCNDLVVFQSSLDCYAALREIFGPSAEAGRVEDGAIARLHALLHTLSVQVLDDEARALCEDVKTFDRDSQRSKVDTRLQLWRARSRKASFTAIADSEGALLTSSAAMSGALRAHWQEVFDAKPICNDTADLLIGRLAAPKLELLVLPPPDAVARYIRSMRDSAPGPDGIPYSAWLAAGALGAQSICDVFQHVLDGGAFPVDARTSLMVFISKAGKDGATAKAEEMRPISLTNTDAKLWASLLNFGLARSFEPIIDSVQKGFVRGRRGSDHVIQLDLQAHCLSMQAPNPAIILADLKAAFPSVAHAFIRKVLVKLLGSHPFCRTILQMYSGLTASILIAGCIIDSLCIGSGLRQGCPLSGTIFAICFQAWTAHVVLHAGARIPARGFRLFAFADDVAFAVADLWDALAFLADMLRALAAASGLHLNAKKTVIIPLWRSPNLPVIALRAAKIERIWRTVLVDLVGKYLGIFVGPAAEATAMQLQLREYRLRCRSISLLGGGWSQALHLHRLVAVPVLSYVMQFYRAPDPATVVEMPALATLFGTPNQAVSPAAVRHIIKLAGARADLPSLVLLSRATLARVWLQLANGPALFAEHCETMESDDSFVISQHPEWTKQLFISTLHANFAALNVILPDPCPPRGIQARIHSLLRLRAVEEPLVAFFARRLRTVFRKSSVDAMNFTAKFATINLARAAVKMNLAHLAGYIRILTNGVISSARMGREIAACHFCNQEAADDIRHWGSCPVIEAIAAECLPFLRFSPCPVDPLDSVLGAFPLSCSRSIGFVIFADLLCFTHAHKRHGDSGNPRTIARVRIRMLRTALPLLSLHFAQLCDIP